MTYSVVILSARAGNLVACLEALRAREPDLTPERIIVVDDGARAEAEARIAPVTWVPGTKPFVFARNANLGIRVAAGDVILLNDDACLVTHRGFTRWSELMAAHRELGVCSAGIQGVVGNPRQHASAQARLVPEAGDLAFVCAYLPRRTLELVGLLDERFVGYGYEDNDYCERTRRSGLQLGIWHGCVVNHDGHLPSTFRSRPGLDALLRQNRDIYMQNGPSRRPGSVPPQSLKTPEQDGVDLLFLAWNRLEFTRETFEALLVNTDWSRVRELCVYDDGSTDGTREWLAENLERVPAAHRLVVTKFGSAVSAMVHYIRQSSAGIVAKLDNDAVVPPGWLSESLGVLERNPTLMLLGIEAMGAVTEGILPDRGYVPAQFISGLGLYRRAAFARSQPVASRKYFGLEEWQMAQRSLTRGWISPALPVFLLDRMPAAPWRTLSDEYIRRGWQRPWESYPPDCALWHWRWPQGTPLTPATARIAGPSSPRNQPEPPLGVRLNLHCGDARVDGFTNVSVSPADPEQFIDLSGKWPWEDGSVAILRAWNLLERLRDKIGTMNELWRVACDGGTVEIVVPTTDGTGAFQDPAHVSYWNRRSFLYYEEGNPYRERFAERYGIRARFAVVAERTERTADGPRLWIQLRAVKGEVKAVSDRASSAPVRPETAAPVAASPGLGLGPQFVCALRVKNEERHLRAVVESVLGLCERVILFDDHSTDGTVQIAQSFGERLQLFHSPFEGFDEARDKNYLLAQLLPIHPAWVLWIDGDEVLERSGPAALRRAAEASRVVAYSLRIAYLWDDPGRVRVDGVYGRFARPSFFRLRGQEPSRLRFATTTHAGNLHCGNVPAGLLGRVAALPVRLKHFGYLSVEERQRKYQWYTRLDPNSRAEDEYRHLVGVPGAVHAPGPPRFIAWME